MSRGRVISVALLVGVYILLVVCCPVGRLLQMYTDAPEFLRFHLSDFATAAFQSMTNLIPVVPCAFIFKNDIRKMNIAQRRRHALAIAIFSIVFSTIVWCLQEVYLEEHTDPIDIAAFGLGGIICLAIVFGVWHITKPLAQQRLDDENNILPEAEFESCRSMS